MLVRWFQNVLDHLMIQLRKDVSRESLGEKNRTRFEIYHEDCVRGMAQLPPESVDVVVTSPPYNLGVKYSSYKDDQQREAHLAWCLQWAEQIKRVQIGRASCREKVDM